MFAHDLAVTMRRVSVGGMLREITWEQFLDWVAYSEVKRFGDAREDARAAFIVRALYNINRDVKEQKEPFKLASLVQDFLEELQEVEQAPRKQTWQQQKSIAHMWVMAYGAAAKARAGKRKRH
jgi:hypothetical protein